MNQGEESENLIMRYLLGDISEAEREQIEKRLLADDEFFEQISQLETELADKYAEGELSERQREQFEQHFLISEEGREQVAIARLLMDYAGREKAKEDTQTDNSAVPDENPAETEHGTTARSAKSNIVHLSIFRRAWANPYLKMAASLLIVAGLGVLLYRLLIYQSDVDKGLAALQRAYKTERPTEARISGLDYAPYLVTRGKTDKVGDVLEKKRAELILLDAVQDHPGVAAYHALGNFYLADKRFDQAVEQFQKALQFTDKDARLHADLGAAFLERASANRDQSNPKDLANSLEETMRALEIDPSMLAAYFNKALCLQRMQVPVRAREAWKIYLEKDSGSEWSKEAARNLQLLEEQPMGSKTPEEVFQDYLQAYQQQDTDRAWRIQSQTKEMITGVMLPFQVAQRFVAATLANQAEVADQMLAILLFSGELDKKKSGDPFFSELAGFYATNGKKQAALLNQAQEIQRQSYQLCLQGRYSEANQPFEQAESLYRQTGDLWDARIAAQWQAYCLTQLGELKKSSAILLALTKECQRHKYHWLNAQSQYGLTINYGLLADYSQMFERGKKALTFATAIGDSYNFQKILSQLAEGYKFVNRLDEALECNQRSLLLNDAYFVSQRQLWRSLFSMTDTLFGLHLYAAAEAYEQEALQLAVAYFHDPVLLHNSYLRLGQVYTGEQKYLAATETLFQSIRSIEALANNPASIKLSGFSLWQMGNVKRLSGDSVAALQYYQQAAQKFGSSEYGLYDYSIQKGILLCHLLNRNDERVENQLPLVVDLYERYRHKIREEQNRNHFFDVEQDVYDLAIDYEANRHNIEQSFYYAETSKARSLLDEITGGSVTSDDTAMPDTVISAVSQPLTFAQLQQRLPANLQVIEYAVLHNRLLVWVVTRSHIEAVEQPVSSSILEPVVNEYLQVLSRSDAVSIEQEQQLAGQLYEWLFAPLKRYLNQANETVIVPDKCLFKIPFAALLSRQSGQRLVEEYTLVYAPSATVMVHCSELAHKKPPDKAAERLLSVGNPAFNRQQHPELADLPAAASECEKIAAFYRSKAIFTNQNAVKERIKAEFIRAEVIHLAAHYLTDELSFSKSRLLLTAKPEATTADDLTLQEIQSMRLPATKLAILSACQSGIERLFAGEGIIGLARAFMVTGIPLVIASQWAVDSNTTAELMIHFHQLRKVQNSTTTQALRQAQIAMLHHADERYRRPYYWAAFFPIGGCVSY